MVELNSSHQEIVIKGGGKCQLHKNGLPNVSVGTFRVEGRQLKATGKISAKIMDLESTEARVVVEDHEPKSSILLNHSNPWKTTFVLCVTNGMRLMTHYNCSLALVI